MTFNPGVLSVRVVASPDEAPNWRRDRCDVRAVGIDEAIIVCNGTQAGRATVDLLIRDEQGAQYVAMLTGRVVQALAAVIDRAEQR